MDKENTNQNITPVVWDENDGKWHFTEKCLNPEFQITYVTNPHTFETPDEAMQAYLGSSQKFSEKMDQMKMREVKIPTFAEELKTSVKPFLEYDGKWVILLALTSNKVIVPDADEQERNPRSRSAKLRIAEKK